MRLISQKICEVERRIGWLGERWESVGNIIMETEVERMFI